MLHKGAILVNFRRFVQAFTLILFFFLVFHTQKFKELSIPILNYIFVICAFLSLLYLVRYLYHAILFRTRREKVAQEPKPSYIKVLLLFILTFALGGLLVYYNQFNPPDRATFINDSSLSINEAISKYYEQKSRYNSIRNLTSINTYVSKEDNAIIMFEFPPMIIYLNYALLFASLLFALFAITKYKLKHNKIAFKRLLASSFILFSVSFLFFLLLDFDFKKEFNDYSGASGFILHYFPTDLTRYYYFISIPNNIFLKLSPLLGIATSLSLGIIIFGIGFILFFLVISFLFGRVFCGWICPFGTLHQITSYIKMKVQGRFEHEPYKNKQKIKYAIFVTIIIVTLFSINLSGFLDPISIVTKSTTFFIIPSAQYAMTYTHSKLEDNAEQEKTVGVYTLLEEGYRYIKEYLEEYIFYFKDPAEEGENYVPTHFKYFFLNGFIFLLLISLNIKTTRFWCRYICPLGAMLGIFANRSVMRINVNDKCTSCTDCEKFCQGAADVGIKGEFKTSECMYCFNCLTACNDDALDIKMTIPTLTKSKQKI